MRDILFEKTTHGFFDGLVSYFTSISALETNFGAQLTGKAKQWLPYHYLTIEGMKSVTNFEIRFFPHDMLNTILNNNWPNEIRLQEIPLTANPPAYPIVLTGLQKVHGSMIQSVFVHYFESYRFQIESKFGSNPIHWPSVWTFGRIIRNAFAHGGEINILNPNSPKVTWKSIEYDSTSNGRNILYNDITPVETIILMDEMDIHRR